MFGIGRCCHDVQAVAFQADDGAAAVGQQDHVLHAEIEQDLRADAVIAQFALRTRAAAASWPHPFGERRLAVLADQHHDAAALAS